jgi:hypothetical protein
MQDSISARFSFRFSSNLARFSWRNNFQELINAAELTNNVEVSTRDRHSICREDCTSNYAPYVLLLHPTGMYQLPVFPTPPIRVELFPAQRLELSVVSQRTESSGAILSG